MNVTVEVFPIALLEVARVDRRIRRIKHNAGIVLLFEVRKNMKDREHKLICWRRVWLTALVD